MLLTKLKRTNLQKAAKATMIGGLVDYVLTQEDEEGFEKNLYSYGLNFMTRTIHA